jgi:hypothetical protein
MEQTKTNGYQMLLNEFIAGQEYLMPITNEDIYAYVIEVTGEKFQTIKTPVNMALSRLEKTRADFFRFQNGIYYRAKKTVFGYGRLDPAAVIRRKYIMDKDEVIGYETGLSLLNKAGLTTQVPAYNFIATNKYKGRGFIKDAQLKAYLARPIAQVNRANYLYLQTLELITALVKNKDAIIAERPRGLVYEHIKRLGLNAERLAYYAGECGGGKLADELVKVFHEGVRHEIA